jgi:hypothetical protein
MNAETKSDSRNPRASLRQNVPTIIQESSCSQHDQISIAAYYLAQQRGFVAGNDLDDWLRAEAVITGAR